MIGSNVTKLRDGVLHTPILEFEHRQHESTLAITGMVHVGTKSYYDTIGAYVAEREVAGSKVHYEKVVAPTASEIAQFPDESEQYERLKRSLALDLPGLIATAAGASKQMDTLTYPAHWENHDMSGLELVRRLGSTATKDSKGTEEQRELVDPLEGMSANTLLRSARIAFRHYALIQSLTRLISPQVMKVIIDDRNNIALDAVEHELQTNPDQDITLIWGSAHIPGIKKGFEAMGYKVTHKEWLPALSLKSISHE